METKRYKGSHRPMPLGRRARLWIYTFPVRDGVRVLVTMVAIFAATLLVLAVLGALSGCKGNGHVFCTGGASGRACVHQE